MMRALPPTVNQRACTRSASGPPTRSPPTTPTKVIAATRPSCSFVSAPPPTPERRSGRQTGMRLSVIASVVIAA